MFYKIEHIGIAVSNLDEGNELYTQLFGEGPYKTETVASEQVITSFFKMGESKIELLAATSPESPIAKFIAKKGAGMHHIAYAVSDIYAEMDKLRALGFTLINEMPKPGADNKLVCFVHPKDAGGVLIELCMDMPKN